MRHSPSCWLQASLKTPRIPVGSGPQVPAAQAFQELLALTTRPGQSNMGGQCDGIWGRAGSFGSRIGWERARTLESNNPGNEPSSSSCGASLRDGVRTTPRRHFAFPGFEGGVAFILFIWIKVQSQVALEIGGLSGL